MTNEPLTSAIVAQGLGKLLEAFPQNLGKRNPAMMADVYKSGLDGIDAGAFRSAIEICIRNDNFFPKVARLREAASEWIRRNRASVSLRLPERWDTCHVCGARAGSPRITRPRKYGTDGEAYYLTAQDYKSPQGAVVEKGRRIPATKLLDALSRGVVLEMETIENPRTHINHFPEAHHIRGGDSDEYQGVA